MCILYYTPVSEVMARGSENIDVNACPGFNMYTRSLDLLPILVIIILDLDYYSLDGQHILFTGHLN